LSLAVIEDDAQYEQVKAFRLQNYQGDYVAKLINADGSDPHDGHSAIFGAWLGHRLVATARLTSWPFELSSYIGEPLFMNALGAGWKTSNLEFSRLLVSKDVRIKSLGRVISGYAAFCAARGSEFTHYIGYAKPIIKNNVLRFNFDENEIYFRIPNRQNQLYQLLSGSFEADLQAVAKMHPHLLQSL